MSDVKASALSLLERGELTSIRPAMPLSSAKQMHQQERKASAEYTTKRCDRLLFSCSFTVCDCQQQTDARKDARDLILRYEQKLAAKSLRSVSNQLHFD